MLYVYVYVYVYVCAGPPGQCVRRSFAKRNSAPKISTHEFELISSKLVNFHTRYEKPLIRGRCV